MIGGSGFLGLCLGLVMSGNGVNGQTLALAGLISVPVLGVGLIIGDTKAQSRINYAEGIASEASRRAENLLSHLEASEEREKYLRNELATIQEGFTRAKELLKACESERCESAAAISQLRSTLASATARLEEVEAEIEEWERSFHSKVETEAQKRFESAKNAEIKRIQEENDAITLEAMGITRAYREWAVEVDARLQDKSEFVKSVMSRYNNHLEGLKGSIDTQIEEYLKQIEILNCKVAALQQQLAGDLVAPEYGKFGYQWDARIADDIARHIWQSMHIPLAVKGFKSNPDGSAEAGYAYSRSHPIEALQRDLNRLSGDIAKRLGIHAIESIKKHDLSELLIVTWRCERPKPIAEDAFYRIVAPASACTKLLREALDHKKGGKPTLRIMGATGEGKGIIAKILLADWVKSESGEIWLSDPMDGSDEDRWEVPKAAKSSREARQLLKEFEGEFRRRKDKISARKDVPVLGLFDEFDKEHPRDDKDLVKSIWTAMRHHKMRLILMGQSSEVGSNGWQWDEMKNCACLFVGSGITTAIKHAKDLGLSRAIASQLESQNDQIQNWLESKNQGLDAANQYRVGLLVCSDKAQFIEFPPAHKGAIERDKSVIVSRPWESVVTDEKEVINELKVCPGCGEKLRKSGSRLRCDSPNHTKDMGVKSFKIEV
jgi:hypothetical protein